MSSPRPISHYEILEKLGEGGMGVVWKARDTLLDRWAALKFLPPAKLADEESKRRFIHEAKATSALNHPNIVTVYEIGSDLGSDFIAMELVDGKPLDQLMRQRAIPLESALDYAVQIAGALAAAHAAGIVHRDLKPGNIMVTESGRVKVLDFGLAKLAGSNAGLETLLTRTIAQTPDTRAGAIVGTPSYMSPEQAEAKAVDARTDVFSFGAVLYEMITGRRAFARDSTASTISAILRDHPQPAREILADLPRDLERILNRCLQKEPNRRYQHAGDLALDLQQVRDDIAKGSAMNGGAARVVRSRWSFAALVGGACLAAVAAAWWLWAPRPRSNAPIARIVRVTNGSGLSRFPALSPDGKLIAYSTDNGSDDNQDLYVRQTGGGQPVRLTSDGAGNITPDFSPDGTKIIFRSNRSGGGIFEIPAFGGEPRLIVRDGAYPKYSPDGSLIAYSLGSEKVSVSVPGSGSLWVVPVAGGEPRQVGQQFTGARYPIWSPDGKRLLFIGYTASKAYQGANEDWWLAPLDGGEPVKTGAYEAMIKAGLRSRATVMDTGPRPACWASDNQILFAAPAGDANSLWEIGISPRTGQVAGGLSRLTTGGGNEQDVSCAGALVAFASLNLVDNVWALPYDLSRGAASGPIRRITESPAVRQYVSLSADGRYLAFASDQAGQNSIWMRDLETGKETRAATSAFRQNWPAISPSGTRVAYSSIEQNDRRMVYVTTPGGVPEKLCEDCLRATSWSHDEKAVLDFRGNPYHVGVIDLESKKETVLVQSAAHNVLYARFSPDNKWISFTVRISPNRGRIIVAGVGGATPVPESSWMPIADVDIDEWAEWSPDGGALYFSSAKDGYSCFWGQRLDPKTRRPAGQPFPVYHLHGRLSYGHGGWSAGGDKIAMALSESRGNVWLMSRSR